MKQYKFPKGQLTPRGLIIGLIGCIILTASSTYTALKLGALPWPIAFAAIISLFFLKLFKSTSLNEANVTHTIMSAGSMVAGALAFTIPAAWMLGFTDQISFSELLFASLVGVLLGLFASAAIHKQSMEDKQLTFPIGVSAAETLRASEKGGSAGKELFGSMAAAGIWSLLRDVFGIIPSFFAEFSLPGLNFAIYNSPMLLSVGFLIGFTPVCFWFLGAALSNVGIVLTQVFNLVAESDAKAFVSSLGMGMMMGSGIAVVAKDILPKALRSCKAKKETSKKEQEDKYLLPLPYLEIGTALAALLLSFACRLPLLPSVLVCALTYITTIMSTQSVGQTGIDPMEIFALIILLIIAALFSLETPKLILIAAVVAVASGLAGDVMNDFKAGDILGTDPRSQWLGQAVGALIGAVVASLVIWILLTAFGADAFGPNKSFIAAQASVVATLISGIPNVFAFGLGLVVAFILYFLHVPVMLIGLGVYLPFYMSITAFLGGFIQFIWQRTHKDAADTGIIFASGVLGGESIAGVLIALWTLFSTL